MGQVKTIRLVNGVSVTAPDDLTTGGGAGGGGGSLNWDEPAGESPIAINENGQYVHEFEAGAGEKLVSFIKIPASHLSTIQIKMKVSYYCADTSGTTLLSATSYLIRNDTDAISSQANSHSSINTAVTQTSPADKLTTIEIDLTDSNGDINGEPAEAGDMIAVELSRGSDTATSSIKFIPNATEVSF